MIKKFLLIISLGFLIFGGIVNNAEGKVNVGIVSAVKNKAKQLKEDKNKSINFGNLQLYFPLHQGDWWQYREYYTDDGSTDTYVVINKGYQNGYWLFVSPEEEKSDNSYYLHISTMYCIVDSEGLKYVYRCL